MMTLHSIKVFAKDIHTDPPRPLKIAKIFLWINYKLVKDNYLVNELSWPYHYCLLGIPKRIWGFRDVIERNGGREEENKTYVSPY